MKTAIATSMAALAAALMAAPAMAQETAAAPAPPVAASPDQQGVLTYPPEYFAAARPATALEMVQRTPGFSFENGSSVRGFAGGAGNVLVDGERPLTKTETLEDILRKIPASSVLRIEVIRGGAPGIDMQGRTVLANVVRKSDVATTGAVALSSHFLWDGRILPGFRAEFQRRGGGRLLELSTIIGQGPDDSTAGGNRIRLSGAGATLIQSDLEARSQGTKYWYTGAYETPFAGGKLRLTSVYQFTPSRAHFYDVLVIPGGVEEESDRINRTNAELGGRYTRNFGPDLNFEGLFLEQLTTTTTDVNFTSPTVARLFALDTRTGETILRGALTWKASSTLSIEFGGEGAANWLTSRTALTVNNVAQVLPSANVRVEETRGEAFVEATWRLRPTVNLEAGVRYEYSQITATGDTSLEKTLSFIKPRLVVTWSPNAQNQLRLRVEREVGQLNFNDFVAASSVASTGTAIAGNPDINPQQAWVIEGAFERRFMGSGVVSLTYRHYELTDVADRIKLIYFTCPAGQTCPPTALTSNFVDSPGNIGDGRRDDIQLSFTLPLRPFGITGGLLKGNITRRLSEVTDPVTGDLREISALRPLEWDLHFSQDLPAWRLNWGIDVFSQWRETYYRVSEIETKVIDTYVLLYTEYKPRPDWVIRMELQNVTARDSFRTREVYSGARDVSGINYVDRRQMQPGQLFLIRVRKLFG